MELLRLIGKEFQDITAPKDMKATGEKPDMSHLAIFELFEF